MISLFKKKGILLLQYLFTVMSFQTGVTFFLQPSWSQKHQQIYTALSHLTTQLMEMAVVKLPKKAIKEPIYSIWLLSLCIFVNLRAIHHHSLSLKRFSPYNENQDIIYPPWCCCNAVCFSFLFGPQKENCHYMNEKILLLWSKKERSAYDIRITPGWVNDHDLNSHFGVKRVKLYFCAPWKKSFKIDLKRHEGE